MLKYKGISCAIWGARFLLYLETHKANLRIAVARSGNCVQYSKNGCSKLTSTEILMCRTFVSKILAWHGLNRESSTFHNYYLNVFRTSIFEVLHTALVSCYRDTLICFATVEASKKCFSQKGTRYVFIFKCYTIETIAYFKSVHENT